jgi:uncharacterized protein (TIGR00251 family)
LKIEVFVKTNQAVNRIDEIGEGKYSVSIKASREKGKANRELLKLLSKHFKGKVKIISGFTRRQKIIEVEIS